MESREFLLEVSLCPGEAQCCLGILQTDPRFQPQLPAPCPDWWPFLSGTICKPPLLMLLLTTIMGSFQSP